MECTLCPRECRVDRRKKSGFCKAGEHSTVSKFMLHQWEEPCICYGSGSGAVFFSGCQLQCVFCQNHEISCSIRGSVMNSAFLCDAFLSLEEKGACNINLVSPTPHLHTVIPALEKAKQMGLSIPIVFNSGGYEKEETIRSLSGLVDIFLPDYKFFDPKIAREYAGAEDYPFVAERAICEMQAQVGKPLWDGNQLKKGVIVRHLVLPSHSHDSEQIIASLASLFKSDDIVLSLLFQYTPMHKAKAIPNLSRKVTSMEYQRVVRTARHFGFQYVYTQKKESASESFIPKFSSISKENS